MKPKAELKSAYYWTCDSCGVDNFGVPIAREYTDGEKEEVFRDQYGLSPDEELPEGWDEFDMQAIPEKVTCKSCGETFETRHESEEQEPPHA